MRDRLFNWIFYGHVWIALAAFGLSWQSMNLALGESALHENQYFVLLATLSVYTLHRWLSYRRAASEPAGRRYALVARYPGISLLIGVLSLLAAVGLAFRMGVFNLSPVLIALPFTAFYLIPLYPGGPRLRDLPYLKTLWVAFAWVLMTDFFAVGNHPTPTPESLVRLLFILAVALLFDIRDVDLDRRQGVRTMAADYPAFNRGLALGLIICCALLSLVCYPPAQAYALAGCYLTGAFIGWNARPDKGEDFYAIYVNGMLLLPPLGLFIAISAAP